MSPVGTLGVQSFTFSDPRPYILIESIHDILKYLNHEIIMVGEYAFLDRVDISISPDSDLNYEREQYFANGLLVTGLLEQLSNDSYHEVQKQFEALTETISQLILKKLKSRKLNSCHCVFVHEDDCGDIVVGFVKKNDRWVEYNDETGYLKLCS